MTNYRIDDGRFIVNGIELCSRHGRMSELLELIDFAEWAKIEDIAQYIKAIYYDSGACIATFEFRVEPLYGDPVWTAVNRIAMETISQFDLLGTVGHGKELLKESLRKEAEWDEMIARRNKRTDATIIRLNERKDR